MIEKTLRLNIEYMYRKPLLIMALIFRSYFGYVNDFFKIIVLSQQHCNCHVNGRHFS